MKTQKKMLADEREGEGGWRKKQRGKIKNLEATAARKFFFPYGRQPSRAMLLIRKPIKRRLFPPIYPSLCFPRNKNHAAAPFLIPVLVHTVESSLGFVYTT